MVSFFSLFVFLISANVRLHYLFMPCVSHNSLIKRYIPMGVCVGSLWLRVGLVTNQVGKAWQKPTGVRGTILYPLFSKILFSRTDEGGGQKINTQQSRFAGGHLRPSTSLPI